MVYDFVPSGACRSIAQPFGLSAGWQKASEKKTDPKAVKPADVQSQKDEKKAPAMAH